MGYCPEPSAERSLPTRATYLSHLQTMLLTAKSRASTSTAICSLAVSGRALRITSTSIVKIDPGQQGHTGVKGEPHDYLIRFNHDEHFALFKHVPLSRGP